MLISAHCLYDDYTLVCVFVTMLYTKIIITEHSDLFVTTMPIINASVSLHCTKKFENIFKEFIYEHLANVFWHHYAVNHLRIVGLFFADFFS